MRDFFKKYKKLYKQTTTTTTQTHTKHIIKDKELSRVIKSTHVDVLKCILAFVLLMMLDGQLSLD